MITITNGTTTKVVTKGVFENIYSKLGYKNVTTSKRVEVVEKETPKEDKIEPKVIKEKETKEQPEKVRSEVSK